MFIAPDDPRFDDVYGAALEADPDTWPCARCGQESAVDPYTDCDAEHVCSACVAREHEPQGEAVRLFTPAPAQMPGQTTLDVPCPDDCTCFLCLAARVRPRRAGQFSCAACGTDEAMPGHEC